MPRALDCPRFYDGGAQRLRRAPIFVKGGRTEPETVSNFHHGAAQSLRRPTIFVKGGAQSLRLSAIFIMGVPRAFGEWRAQKMPKAFDCRRFYDMGCKQPETSPNFRAGGCSEPETVGNVQHGGAQSLRRPPIFVSGMHKKCSEPETVCNFIMGVHRA